MICDQIFGICSIITRATDKTLLEQQALDDREIACTSSRVEVQERKKPLPLSLRKIGVKRAGLWYRA
jgi:hypothetical protein